MTLKQLLNLLSYDGTIWIHNLGSGAISKIEYIEDDDVLYLEVIEITVKKNSIHISIA